MEDIHLQEQKSKQEVKQQQHQDSISVQYAKKLEREIADVIIASFFAALKTSPIEEIAVMADRPEVRAELQSIICKILPIDDIVKCTEVCCQAECRTNIFQRCFQWLCCCFKKKKSE
jgi:hypothetical protein